MFVITMTPTRNAAGQQRPIVGKDKNSLVAFWVTEEMSKLQDEGLAFADEAHLKLQDDTRQLQDGGICLRGDWVVCLDEARLAH